MNQPAETGWAPWGESPKPGQRKVLEAVLELSSSLLWVTPDGTLIPPPPNSSHRNTRDPSLRPTHLIPQKHQSPLSQAQPPHATETPEPPQPAHFLLYSLLQGYQTRSILSSLPQPSRVGAMLPTHSQGRCGKPFPSPLGPSMATVRELYSRPKRKAKFCFPWGCSGFYHTEGWDGLWCQPLSRHWDSGSKWEAQSRTTGCTPLAALLVLTLPLAYPSVFSFF